MSETTGAKTNTEAAGQHERLVMPGDDKWIVCWKYKDGSRSGHGEPILKADAEAAAVLANKNYPHIRHWVIQA